MWGVVYKILSEHTGFSPEEIHEVCRHKFLKDWVLLQKKDGAYTEVESAKSTTSLSTSDMEKYLESIRIWASADLGCFIPLPNEANYSTI